MEISQKTLEFIAKKDILLDKRNGWDAKNLMKYAVALTAGQVEVGWRETCGTTDMTMHTYREWVKVVSKLKKDGFVISEERVKHKNAYASNNGGFWNSIIYKVG